MKNLLFISTLFNDALSYILSLTLELTKIICVCTINCTNNFYLTFISQCSHAQLFSTLDHYQLWNPGMPVMNVMMCQQYLSVSTPMSCVIMINDNQPVMTTGSGGIGKQLDLIYNKRWLVLFRINIKILTLECDRTVLTI